MDTPAQYTAAQKACSYILNRIQTDPDLRYYAGPLTESFHLLCVAQAEYTGRPLAEIEAERAKDLQPEYRTRQPEVLALRARLETAVEVDVETLRADRDYYKSAYSRKLDDEKRALEAAQAAVAVSDALADALEAVLGSDPNTMADAHDAAIAALRAAGRLP